MTEHRITITFETDDATQAHNVYLALELLAHELFHNVLVRHTTIADDGYTERQYTEPH